MPTVSLQELPPQLRVVPPDARLDVVTKITNDPAFRKLRAITHDAARDLVGKIDTTNAGNKVMAIEATMPTLRVVKETHATASEILAAELIVHSQLIEQESAGKKGLR